MGLIADFAKALAQMGDPRFLRVLLGSLALTVRRWRGVLGGDVWRSAGCCRRR